MLSLEETEQIRQVLYQEMARLHRAVTAASAGTYNYLCLVGGHPTFTHQPIGTVLQQVHHGQ
jgi:hypothetical protein